MLRLAPNTSLACLGALASIVALGGCEPTKAHVVASASAAMATAAVAPRASSASAAGSANIAPSATAAASAPTPSACPDAMALVQGGLLSTLEHGHDVSVASYCLDREEVSVARFRRATQAGQVARGCAKGATCPDVPMYTAWFGDGDAAGQSEEDSKVSRFCNGQRKDVDDHPVNCVSFAEAEGFCRSIGARLPTGDEWEWAAHGKRPTPWGSPIATNEPCWGKPKKRVGTCPIRSMPKDHTDDDVWDLGGNVSEWVTAPKRATASKAHWAYGASWYAIDDGYARAALGGMEMPAKRAETVGFRCARDVAVHAP